MEIVLVFFSYHIFPLLHKSRVCERLNWVFCVKFSYYFVLLNACKHWYKIAVLIKMHFFMIPLFYINHLSYSTTES